MHSKVVDLFFNLLQFSVGGALRIDHIITEREWSELYDISGKQSLVGVIFEGVQKLSDNNSSQKPPLALLYEWIGQCELISNNNKLLDKQCKQLSVYFQDDSIECCVIKGQGVARLYPNPASRQPGDIDIWVNDNDYDSISKTRDVIVGKMRSKGIDVTVVDYINCHAAFFDDTVVEVHFRPTWFYNPFANRKLQKWIQENKELQMKEFDGEVGFGYPTIAFNLVFSLLHIYKHVFEEGIGLRQLTDYYFILRHSTERERLEAYSTLKSFNLGKFVATIMYIMKRVYNIDTEMMLCKPNESEGVFLLSEILRGGNFGQYDDRINRIYSDNPWRRGYDNLKRNLLFLKHYPNEVAWIPAWKTWHWCWRKLHGYM